MVVYAILNCCNKQPMSSAATAVVFDIVALVVANPAYFSLTFNGISE
jgi:hypothetical protein